MNFLNLTNDDKELLTTIFDRYAFATNMRLETLFKVLEVAANHQQPDTASRAVLHAVKEALAHYESLIEQLSQKYPGIERDAGFRKLAAGAAAWEGVHLTINDWHFVITVQEYATTARTFEEAVWAAEEAVKRRAEELQESFHRRAHILDKLT